MTDARPDRARPSRELMKSLREAKAELHQQRERLNLPEKLLLVLELQRIYLPLLKRLRPLRPWERPWQIEP